MTELAAALRFARARLKATAALRGHAIETTARENVPDAITIRFLPSTDHEGQAGDAAFTTVPLQVVLSVASDALTPEIVAKGQAIKEALHRVSGSVEGGEVYLSKRLAPIYYPETVDGVTWQYVGGLFEIEARGG